MKKSLLVTAAALLFFTTISYSQDKSGGNFWFGPKVGVDLATPTINQDDIESQVASNFQAGIFMQFGRKFYLQPEIYYATQKQEYDDDGTMSEATVNSLRVPFMLGMRVINLGLVSAHVMAGPTASILLSESAPDPSGPREKTKFTLQGGGGVDALGFLTLDVRYSVDIGGNTSTQIKQLNWDSGVNVTLGIKLR
jgi:hypothetical protein